MKTKRFTILFCLMFALGAFAAEPNEPVWIDVRTWGEHLVDSIDGDQQIHYTDLKDELPDLIPDRSRQINLYCAAGVRAQKGVNILKKLGYQNVRNLGGIDEVRKLRQVSADAGQTEHAITPPSEPSSIESQ